MRPRHLLGAVLTGVVLAAVVGTAFADNNVVSATRLGQQVSATSVDDKKQKPDCNGITVVNLVQNANGGNGNDLIVGDSTVQTLKGNAGDDCIHGGGGNDSLTGGTGTDVCIGGPGTDTFHPSCETQIQ